MKVITIAQNQKLNYIKFKSFKNVKISLKWNNDYDEKF